MSEEYLVSICIPTYNRVDALRASLEDIVRNESFDQDVEIVISDNGSNDGTRDMIASYTEQFSNIKYYRNDDNLIDENFWLAINRARGQYIKLQNDYYSFTDDGLGLIKQYVKENLSEKSLLFFTDNNIYSQSGITIYSGSGINEYISMVSTFVTAINLFGIWREDIPLISQPLRHKIHKLLQVDWTYQLITKKNEFTLINYPICRRLYTSPVSRDIKYDWFEIHVKNYYDIMLEFCEDIIGEKGVNDATITKDKELCMKHFRKQYFDTFLYAPPNFTYDRYNTRKILEEYCGDCKEYLKYKRLLPLARLLYPYFYLRNSDNMVKRILKKVRAIVK